MVVGLDLFIQHVESYTDHYVLIGGSACDWQMEQKGLPFRATKDIDIILVVEAASDEFVNHFWQFIKDGEYAITQVGEKKQFYRFIKPQAEGFPKMIELFSRRPDLIKEVEGMHLTDIPTSEEASSLSAILLDEEYYKFALSNTQRIDGLHLANDFALICLKARAFLNNAKRKANGEEVRSDEISKHKNDVIRLTATLTPNVVITIPDIVKQDLTEYINIIRTENPDIKQLLKNQGAANTTLDQIIEQLEITFSLKQ
jgi:hypothetical protein